MQYASIGWSVGATLGYAQAAPQKRVITCVGDGSFQVIRFDSNLSHNIISSLFFFIILKTLEICIIFDSLLWYLGTSYDH